MRVAYTYPERSGGAKIEAPPLPFLSDTFVMRKDPWEFIQRTMLSVPDTQGRAQQNILIITGMGGCGKTQLTRKFIDDYRDRYVSRTLFKPSHLSQGLPRYYSSMVVARIAYVQTWFETYDL